MTIRILALCAFLLCLAVLIYGITHCGPRWALAALAGCLGYLLGFIIGDQCKLGLLDR